MKSNVFVKIIIPLNEVIIKSSALKSLRDVIENKVNAECECPPTDYQKKANLHYLLTRRSLTCRQEFFRLEKPGRIYVNDMYVTDRTIGSTTFTTEKEKKMLMDD